jgi:hypothetical protein
MSFKVYNLAIAANAPAFEELNLAIINEANGKVILTDNEAIHTVYGSVNDAVLVNGATVQDILNTPIVGEVEKVGAWVRRFGSRIERNYDLLLNSIKEIGLDPKDFPRQ